MNIWPFRSRPVVTPFTDDFSGRIYTDGLIHTTSPINVSIPGNLYIMPTSIVITITAGAGIRGTLPSCFFVYRGQLMFAGSGWGRIISSAVNRFFLADYGDDFAPAGSTDCACYQLPKQIYLYPNDQLQFVIPTLLGTDIVHPITIHGQFWEVH